EDGRVGPPAADSGLAQQDGEPRLAIRVSTGTGTADESQNGRRSVAALMRVDPFGELGQPDPTSLEGTVEQCRAFVVRQHAQAVDHGSRSRRRRRALKRTDLARPEALVEEPDAGQAGAAVRSNVEVWPAAHRHLP